MKKVILLFSSLFILSGTHVSAFNLSVDVNEVLEQREVTFSNNDLIELFSGEWVVGEDISAGRYEITSTSTSGNFVVMNESNLPIVNEILGDNAFDMGVSSITIDLSKGQIINISGMDDVLFTPIESSLKEGSLTAGTWIVGTDVKAGKYIATTPKGSGNLVVTSNSIPVVNEILTSDKDSSMGLGVEKVQLSLKEGQVIIVSGVNEVYLELKGE